MKLLIVYYSQTGNTRAIARLLSEMLKAELFEIRTVKRYPDDYDVLLGLGKKEVESGYLPPILEGFPDFDSYDGIVLGTPVWWGAPAPAVRSFLSGRSWKGKRVFPFATNGGSVGRTTTELKRRMRGAVFAPTLNLRFEDSTLISSEKAIAEWVAKIE